jgi:hypothetical protein
MKVEVPKIHFSRLDKCIVMIQQVLRLERQERWSTRKKHGPMTKNAVKIFFIENSFGTFIYDFFNYARLIMHTFQHQFDSMNFEKHVQPLCA